LDTFERRLFVLKKMQSRDLEGEAAEGEAGNTVHASIAANMRRQTRSYRAEAEKVPESWQCDSTGQQLALGDRVRWVKADGDIPEGEAGVVASWHNTERAIVKMQGGMKFPLKMAQLVKVEDYTPHVASEATAPSPSSPRIRPSSPPQQASSAATCALCPSMETSPPSSRSSAPASRSRWAQKRRQLQVETQKRRMWFVEPRVELQTAAVKELDVSGLEAKQKQKELAFETQRRAVEEQFGLVLETGQTAQDQKQQHPPANETHNKSLLIWREEQVDAGWDMKGTGYQMKAGEVVMTV